MKYGFVYIWFDRKHKRYYVGCHWGNIDDGYICSSAWLRRSFRRRPDDFRRRVISLVYTTRQDLLEEEYRWLQMMKPEELAGPRYYNISNKLFNHWTTDDTKRQTTRQKLSKASKKLHQDPEYKAKYNAGREQLREKKQSPELIARRAKAIKTAKETQFPLDKRKVRSVKGSEEHSKKLSEASNKRWANPDAKAKQSIISREINKGKQRRLGHINTLEHRQKISESLKGKKHSPERIQKIADAKRGKPMPEGFKEARSAMMKEMWAKRKAGLLPMPEYS